MQCGNYGWNGDHRLTRRPVPCALRCCRKCRKSFTESAYLSVLSSNRSPVAVPCASPPTVSESRRSSVAVAPYPTPSSCVSEAPQTLWNTINFWRKGHQISAQQQRYVTFKGFDVHLERRIEAAASLLVHHLYKLASIALARRHNYESLNFVPITDLTFVVKKYSVAWWSVDWKCCGEVSWMFSLQQVLCTIQLRV